MLSTMLGGRRQLQPKPHKPPQAASHAAPLGGNTTLLLGLGLTIIVLTLIVLLGLSIFHTFYPKRSKRNGIRKTEDLLPNTGETSELKSLPNTSSLKRPDASCADDSPRDPQWLQEYGLESQMRSSSKAMICVPAEVAEEMQYSPGELADAMSDGKRHTMTAQERICSVVYTSMEGFQGELSQDAI
ncbi:unnamed protein product [Protopolystoma xenopodis]|uniref:Uncharacterized protein n=1 Tax=Protopolystoma xenopodis TaxID=117903 RepID=A0A3S5BRU2_9PLAT|nr:unnamed protein product [Protopolystoma xenopodis]